MDSEHQPPFIDTLPLTDQQRVDMAVFLDEMLYRIKGKPHKAPVPPAIAHNMDARVAWLRDAYAHDLQSSHPRFHDWKTDPATIERYIGKIVAQCPNGVYTDAEGRKINVFDLIGDLNIPYLPVLPKPARNIEAVRLEAYRALPLEKQQLIDAVIFLDMAASTHNHLRLEYIPRTDVASRRIKWRVAQQREFCAADMNSAHPTIDWDKVPPETIDYVLEIIAQSPNGIYEGPKYKGLPVGELVEHLDSLPYPKHMPKGKAAGRAM